MISPGSVRICIFAAPKRFPVITGYGANRIDAICARHPAAVGLGPNLAPAKRQDHALAAMFRLRKKSFGPFDDLTSVQRWLASLPANDPLAVQRDLVAELRRLAERTAPRTPSGLAAVFIVDRKTKRVVRTLMAQYAEHAIRSSKIENQLWHALFDLTQGFQACYAAFAREIADHAHDGKWQILLPELIARQLVHLGHDAMIRLYRCEPWIPAKWAELHATFTHACAQKLERQPIVLSAKRGATTIEREYLAVLLLLLADPGNLTSKQIEWVAAQLHEWCQPLRLTVEPRGASTFYVDLTGTAGLRRRALGPIDGRVLFVNTRPLHAQLVQKRAELESAAKTHPQSEKAPRQREQLELFASLASRIEPEFRPVARRGERTPASGTVDAIIGFANITGFLRDDIPPSTAEYDSGRSYANTMDLAVFGRTRTEPDNRFEHARRRLAAFSAPGGQWEMKDMSASGFRLHAPMSVATEVTLSMLVAINRGGPDTWVMGIVRRMRRVSADRADIGLQLIANTVISADLVEQRKTDDANYAVEGEQAPLAGRRFRGLVLSFSKRAGGATVQSLIVPPVEYQPAKRYMLQMPGSARPIRYGRLLEQHIDWVWTVVEPIEPDADAVGAAPDA
jgi:hypothetical protein